MTIKRSMAQHRKPSFYLGDWCVIPDQCRLQNNQEVKQLQPKLMDVLLHLADHPGQVISTDELINACWMGMPISDNPIHKTMAELRKALGDSTDEPSYIKTVPRKGYVLIGKVSHRLTQVQDTEPIWRDGHPFCGARPMQAKHKDIFFGRDRALAECVQLFERIHPDEQVIIQLSGSSGCGKTSFMQAGVLPRLLNPYKPFKLSYPDCINWDLSIHSSIDTLLSDLVRHDLLNSEAGHTAELAAQWRANPKSLSVTPVGDSNTRTLVFIDQLEHWLLTDQKDQAQCNRADELWQLIAQLNSSGRCQLILAGRDEVSQSVQQALTSQQPDSEVRVYRLADMSVPEKLDWLSRTVQAAGLFFAVHRSRQNTLMDQFKQLLSRYHISLTAMQVIFKRLAEADDGSELSYRSYQNMGGLEGIMAVHHERTYKQLDRTTQQRLNALFARLIGFKSLEHQRPVLKYIRLEDVLPELGPAAFSRLVDLRLLKTDLRKERVEVSFNERKMVQLWPRLSTWVNSHQALLLRQVELHVLQTRWQHTGRPDSGLLNATDYHKLVSKQDFSDQPISELTAEFIHASKINLNHTRRRQWVIAALLLISLGLTGLFWWRNTSSQSQLDQTLNQLMTLSQSVSQDISPALSQKGENTLLKQLSDQVIQVYQTNRDQLNPEQWIDYLSTFNHLGALSANQRDDAQAQGYFEQAISLSADSRFAGDAGVMNQAMLAHFWLGNLAFQRQEYHSAEPHWQRYLSTAQSLREREPLNQLWILEHSYALNNLGSLYEKTGQLERARQQFSQSIALKTSLLEQQPDDQQLIADLADSLSWEGNVYRRQGALMAAFEAYQRSLELTETLQADHQSVNMKLHRESLALHRMASVTFDLGDTQAALRLAERAIDKSLHLNHLEPEAHNHKTELLGLHVLNATIDRHAGQYDGALQHIQQASQLIDFFKLNLRMSPKIAAFQMRLKLEQAMQFVHHQQPVAALKAIEEGMQVWQDQQVTNLTSAQLSYVQLSLAHENIIAMMSGTEQPVREVASQLQLDNAAAQVNRMLLKNPNNQQLMALYLTLEHARQGEVSGHEYVRLLKQSEYRNPEYYQPLIDHQLITYQP
jgi:DNA-binding winged helix-turn-helix (wHTH) protein/tetratricopeptide (TPR) repeat protein